MPLLPMPDFPVDLKENVDYRIPSRNDLIFKDESIFSFDTPESENGVYICLKEFVAIDKDHLNLYKSKKNQRIFLNYKIQNVIKASNKQSGCEGSDTKRTKIAIGIEGGFQRPEDLFDVKEIFTLVCFAPHEITIPLPNNTLPQSLIACIEAIEKADSAVLAQQKANTAQWEGDVLVVSKHAENLRQLDITEKIPPLGWKCAECDFRENLWLNLTDGSIRCGRKNWDGTGGNNHAIEHYQRTGFPLAVKLGTITSKGGDVYSYAEDDMVLDPWLSSHLAHFGIDIMKLEKTDKSVSELEIEMNERTGEWLAMQESEHSLQLLYGAGGYTGIRNLGNSCYLNATMQVIFAIPDFIACYARNVERIFEQELSQSTPIYKSFSVQMAKLGAGLLSDRYSHPQLTMEEVENLPIGSIKPPQSGIRPQLFKLVVGENHPEFSTKSQQDVQEFILHLSSLIEKDIKRRNYSIDPLDAIRFQIGEKLQCGLTKKIRFSKRTDLILTLPIPMDQATTISSETEENKRPKVPIMSCFRSFISNEMIDDFRCPISIPPGQKTIAFKRSGIVTFPDYLCVQASRFTIGADWVPQKLDVEITFDNNGDEEIDLSELKINLELQEGEEAMPDDDDNGNANQQQGGSEAAIQIDEGVVEQLMNMGFPLHGCRKAVHFTSNNGVEPAINWIMEHMSDPDFDQPLAVKSASSNIQVSAEGISMLMEMGFTRLQATEALKKTDNNLERAADYAFSHMDELTAMEITETPSTQPPAPTSATEQTRLRNGTPRYRLWAMISHMGRSTHTGHYVCHIRRAGRWVIYNDEKVALSEAPPIGLAYVYWFRRTDLPDSSE